MEPTSREDLSALMDGELAAEPTRFLMRRLDHDPELAATWSRWHLIRACLSADPARMAAPQVDNDFAARVAAVLAEEPVTRSHRMRWAKYVGGGAIAAGVAVAALMLNSPNPDFGGPPAPMAQTEAAPGPALATASNPMPAVMPLVPAWQLTRQPTVLGAQPASANVVYGTGLMQPQYLRRAAYASGTMLPYEASAGAVQPGPPFSLVLVPEAAPPSAASAAGH